MDLHIQSIHFTPSEALNKKIKERLEKAFGPYPYITKGNVFIKIQENEPLEKGVLEIRLSLPHKELFAETRDNNLYQALDQTIAKLKRQLERYKEKLYAK